MNDNTRPHLHRTLEEQKAWLKSRNLYVLTCKPGSNPKHSVVNQEPNVAATIQAERNRIARANRLATKAKALGDANGLTNSA